MINTARAQVIAQEMQSIVHEHGGKRDLPMSGKTVWDVSALVTSGVRIAGAAGILVGAFWLAAWLGGFAAQWSAVQGQIIMKTNMSIGQILAGGSLLLLGAPTVGRSWRIVGTLAALMVLIIGALTLSQHLFHYDLGIDQLLASEAAGAAATLSPNRMGYPGSLSLTLLGAGLLALAWKWRPVAPYLGLAVCIVNLLPAVGFVYGIDLFYSRPLTGVAWPTVLVLSTLGIGLILAHRDGGLMVLLLRDDLGGVLLRRLLPGALTVPLVLGFVKTQGERMGLYDTATGTGGLMIVMVLLLSVLVFRAARVLSRADATRLKAEKQARNQAELMDRAREPLIVRELGGSVVSWNQGAEALYGWRSAEVLGRNVHDLLHTEGTPLEDMNKQLERTGHWEGELIRTTRDGRRVSVESYQTATRSPDGHLLILKSDRDITERKQTVEALRESEQRLALAVSGTHIGLFDWNVPTGEILWNKEHEKIFGLDTTTTTTLSEAYKYNDWAQRIHPEDLPHVEAELRRCMNEPAPFEKDYRIMWSDGSLHWVASRGVFSFDERGAAIRLVGIVMDITERKRAEAEMLISLELHTKTQLLTEQNAELEQARRALEEKADELALASKYKSEFLANMSHELRTPLNAILGFSRLMRNATNVTVEQMRNLDIINRSGDYLLHLINSVLDISKIEAGHLALEESNFDLHQLLHEIGSLMHAQAAEKGLAFRLVLSPDLPRFVSADEGKLHQVLLNLVGNAIKFTRSGGVFLRAAIVRKDSQPARLRFEAEDSGPGIPAQDMERIFLPFEGLSDTTAAQHGTGLGLFISKQHVELMGGHIGVGTQLGAGSVFHFELPLRMSTLSEENSAKPLQRRVVGLIPGQQHYRLLIVEDQPENRLLLLKLLEPIGFDLRKAVNGREAVALAEQWHPHLIWMDVRMPEMDGLQAARQIRSGEAGAQTKIVALTAHALEDERAEILAAGCDDFIRKPYRDAEIFEALEKNLGVRFLYGENKPLSTAAGNGTVSVAQLRKLPPDLLDELRHAAELLDGQLCLDIAGRICVIDHESGARLQRMVENLQYKELLALLDSFIARTAT